jgi:hypothetical protein
MSVRFAPTVHGEGDNGFMTMIVAADRPPVRPPTYGPMFDEALN